jgi:hypothetical protein
MRHTIMTVAKIPAMAIVNQAPRGTLRKPDERKIPSKHPKTTKIGKAMSGLILPTMIAANNTKIDVMKVTQTMQNP